MQGALILSNSNSLPDHTDQPQSPAVTAVTPFEHMAIDIHALEREAMATQTTVQQLLGRPTVDPLTTILSEIPAIPAINTTAIGAFLVPSAALALVLWFVWQRQRTRRSQDSDEYLEIHEPLSNFGVLHEPVSAPDPKSNENPPQEANGRSQAHAIGAEAKPSAQTPLSKNVFPRFEAPVGFDSEAAASEVIRVRKSLAVKREARALLLERDEQPSLAPLHPIATAPVNASQTSDPSDPDVFMSMVGTTKKLEQRPEPEQVPEQTADPDFSITLALAQESETLEMWHEARELATEALETADPALREQALDLLKRIDSKGQEVAQDSRMLDIEL